MLQFVHRTATLRLVGADGVTPITNQRLRLRWLDHPHTDTSSWFASFRETTRTGVLQLDPAPPGALQVVAVAGEGRPEVVLGTVTVAAPSVAATLPLPEIRRAHARRAGGSAKGALARIASWRSSRSLLWRRLPAERMASVCNISVAILWHHRRWL